MTHRGHRAGGVVILLLAAAVALEATTFDVAFPTDPLGPKAFPLVAAFLLACGGVALVGGRRTRDAGELGPNTAATDPAGMVPPTADASGVRVALAAVSFVVYALLLAPLGFIVATTLEFTALTSLFGGRPGQGAAAGLAFSLLLYGLVVYGLGLPLPLGVLAR